MRGGEAHGSKEIWEPTPSASLGTSPWPGVAALSRAPLERGHARGEGGGVESRGRAVRIKGGISMRWGYQHHNAGTFIGCPSLEREAGGAGAPSS
eukprot:1967614-Pyramimonas_sp.AAC.1